ncbi:MAG: putative manganese-dependent inorganic diphosphatase [Sphaerochaetaceae bacterium]|nr:putative manganese-dependent inorganic diphosphatase [Sphaerochaetaceae bacterium]MDC7237335.1 putative manganese-dependent inorganic diphosphatase [Sphaerochaetaceae bacterium]MDC7249094.1 putative manganese-dependent inorganic diphosphatase [Sphaerochaetaceae bacterium]
MEKILVCGHRNPDMDSICSAWAYANLENELNKEKEYIPARCGALNESTKQVFKKLNIEPPVFVKDVRTRVSSVYVKPKITIDCKEPVYDLMNIFNKNDISVVPVTKDGKFLGLLSIDDVNKYFLRDASSQKPFYKINIDKLSQVMKGTFIKRGEKNCHNLQIMVAAMSFTQFKEVFDKIDDNNLPLLVVGDRLEPLLEAIYRQVPLIILTKMSDKIKRLVDFSNFKGTVFLSDCHTNETLRLLRLCTPVEDLLEINTPVLTPNTLFDEAKNVLINSHFRGLPVFENEEFKGFVTRRCFIEKPKANIIMVDHNESDQGLPGIEEGNIVGIIDHHRFGASKTTNPIFIYSAPLGSTCTLVTQLYERNGVKITKETAKILLSGLVSDTVILKSPTTTSEDLRVAKVLCSAAEIDDIKAFGEEMFASGLSIAKQNPRKVIEGDFKVYKEHGLKLGIGQCEVTTLKDLDDYKDQYLKTLMEVKNSNGLDWALFLITNVVKQNSILLTTGLDTVEYKFIYEKKADNTFFLPDVLSRKKQLLPEVIRVLDE